MSTPTPTPPRPGSPRPGDPGFAGPVAVPAPLSPTQLPEQAPRAPSPLALGTSPGTLDLSLPTNQQLRAAADPGTLTRLDAANRGVALLNAKVAAGGALTTNETRYLNAYYDHLATSGTFTRLESSVQSAAPLAYQSSQAGDRAVDTTLSTVANGLMKLSQVDNGKQMPASVTGLLHQPVGPAADPTNSGQSRGPDGRPVIAGLKQYEGTAGVLGRATVDGGESFTRQMGQSALRVKQELTASAPFVDGMQTSTGDPDADAGFIQGEQQRHRDVADAGEPAINRMLNVVARDTEASQSLLGVNPDGTVTPAAADRHTLVGAGWEDGSGASNVLRAATAPVQASPVLADHSAALTRTIFNELGQDQQGWRELIPKGSAVSDTLTDLTASRIDGFTESPDTKSTLELAQPVDGGYRSFLRFGENHGTDDRTGVLKFIASGAEPTSQSGDADVQRIRTAADTHVVEQLTASLRQGGDGSVALNQAGNLDGIIGSSQYKALIDEHAAADLATASLVQDRTTGLRMTERVLAVLATASLPSPVSALVKDPFNAAFDDALRAVTAAPKPTEPISATTLFAQDNADYAGHRDYLVAQALTQAGQVPPGDYQLIFENGRLRPYGDITDDLRIPDGSGSALSELRHMVNASRPGDTTWAKAFESTATDRGAYNPGLYTYVEPTRPLSQDIQQQIQQGAR